jgi:hypothetical protein
VITGRFAAAARVVTCTNPARNGRGGTDGTLAGIDIPREKRVEIAPISMASRDCPEDLVQTA